MSKQSIKATLAHYFKFLKENVGDYQISFFPETASGVEVVVDYSTYVRNGDYDFDVTHVRVRLDKDATKLIQFLGYDADRDWSNQIDVRDDMFTYLGNIIDQSSDIWEALQEFDEFYDLEETFNLDELHETYVNFEDFWIDVESETDIGKTEIELNDEYVAVFSKGDEYVTVGCQSIHIDKIRNLVKAWDAAQK